MNERKKSTQKVCLFVCFSQNIFCVYLFQCNNVGVLFAKGVPPNNENNLTPNLKSTQWRTKKKAAKGTNIELGIGERQTESKRY